jgi:protein phosphatase
VGKNDFSDTDEFLPLIPPEDRRPQTLSSLVEVDLGALSHPGKVRLNNEDHYLVARFDRSMQVLLTNLAPGQVPAKSVEAGYGMLVADGLGGAAAGEVASSMAIRVLIDLVLATPDWIMRLDERRVQDMLRRLAGYLERVNQALAEHSRAEPGLSGMATTMTLACSIGADLFLAHVGDSRACRCRRGRLEWLTRDHTLARAMAESGEIPPDEVSTHRLRHVLTNAIGPGSEPVQVDLLHLLLEDGDQVLLCTDGLSEMVPEPVIAAELSRPGPAAEVCRALVEHALEGGGIDNVTAVLGRYRIPGV